MFKVCVYLHFSYTHTHTHTQIFLKALISVSVKNLIEILRVVSEVKLAER